MQTKATWFQNPEKKHLLLFAALWLVGSVLQAASLTNFFTAPIASKSSAAIWMLLWLPATTALGRLFGNYLRQQRPTA